MADLTVDALWKGAILGGIVNAVMTAEASAFAPFRQWIRNHYVVRGGDGREGVVTFTGGHWYANAPLVGVFFAPKSNRNPFLQNGEWLFDQAFEEMPSYQLDLAHQAAMTFLQAEHEGQTIALVTTAFWDRDRNLTATDSWNVVLENGVDLIADELLGSSRSAIERWQTAYEMSDAQIQFAWSLFDRKTKHPPARISLTESESGWLQSQAQDSEAFGMSCKLFHEMDIAVAPLKDEH